MYIYQSLIFIVFLSGFIESISKTTTTTTTTFLKQNLSSNQYQQEQFEQQQNSKSLDNSNKQPYVYLKLKQQQQQQKKQQQSISTIEKHQFDKNQHHQNQFNHSSSNMDNFNIIQDLNQSKNEQKNKLTTNTIDKTNITTTNTITTISNFNTNNKTTNTYGLKRRKKSLSQSSSIIGASSISSLKASGLNDNNYDNNHDDENNNDDIDNNNDDDYDYYYKKNLNTVEELSSSEESSSSIQQSIPNENYAYEDIIENHNLHNIRENLDTISSNHSSSNTNLNEPKQLQQDYDEKNEQLKQWQDISYEQQQYNNNNNNYIKESESTGSSSRNDDNHYNNNSNNNNNKITSNDQPYMMHSRVKPPQLHSSHQINKLLYTNEFHLKQGKIKGIIRTFHSQSGLRDVNQFLGIPYAEAPVGSRRFLPPGVPLPWKGLKIASHLPPVCPQNLPNPNLANVKLPKARYDQLMRLLPYLKNENEDCLNLNVYVPQEDRYNKGEKYPVIVYIHGESYEWNSGNPYDGSVLASYGQVIVVTINYRLGILGFMKPGFSQDTVSNFGLFDQIAALKWIKDNIESFGGDSNRVTLMGHSTGAACVNLLMVSPVANGLFHRAILMSGSAMADWATTNRSLHLTNEIANGVNCFINDNDDEMLKCFRSKRYKDFLKVPIAVPAFVSAIGPIVDGVIIQQQPYKMMSQITETFGKYDLLFGVTELESYHILDSIALDDGLTEKERDQFLRLYMNSRYEIRPDLAVAATLKQYMDVYNNPSKATKHEHRDVVLDIVSDARIVGPLLQTGLFHAEVNPRNYMYVFGHNSEAGPYSSLPHSVVGEELAFVFGAPLAPAGPFHQKYSTSEKLLSEAVMTYWTNFAKTGNPKAPWKGGFINSHRMEWANYDIDWPEFNKRNQCYVNIGIPPSLEMKYRNIYMNFWNKELPNELNEIAAMQTKPKIHFYPSSNNGVTQRNNYNRNDEIIAGHIQKFPTNGGSGSHLSGGLNSHQKSDNPIHELKMLMKEDQNHLGYDGDGSIGNSDRNGGGGNNYNNFQNNNNGYSPVDNMLNAQPTFGITHYKSGESSSSSSKDDNAMIPIVNYSNESDEVPKDILRSESALHILIGLIVLFLILNIIIYSTFLFKRKKKNSNQLNRKLGAFISYDGTNDEDLKRSKTNDNCDDSYIMDMVKRSNNGYDYVKGKSLSINGFKFARQLSTSTVDAHTKVSDWMSNDIDKNSIVTKSSMKTSPSFSLKGRSFLRRPHKVSVAVDATPQARSDSILRQEPIEISKYKDLDNNTRSIIICQEIDVDADMLEPDIYDNGQDMGAYGYAVIRKDLQNHNDNRFNGESQYITAFNAPQTFNDEQVTSFIDDNRSDVNIATPRQHQLQQKYNKNTEKIPTVLENRNYQNIILPNVLNNDEQLKRQSLPASSYGSYILNKMPPAPPPRTISTLGRKPSTRHRESSADITTSPLAIAKDSNSDESEDLPITENTLIVGPLLPKTHESIYSTLKKKSQQKENKTQNNKIEETEEISTEIEIEDVNEKENNENSIKIEICAENFNDKLKSSDKKPSGIKPPTIFPLKTAAELKEQILNRTLAATNANGINNITRMSLLGMAKSNKNSVEKSKIPQLMTTPENRSHKYRDKSKSIDSSSSESSSSTETVKTELKQVTK